MLLQFLVENYASIRDEVVLNLEPSVDKEHEENIVSKGKYKANKLVAIYGANASGKTGVYKAMTMALIILRASNIRQVNDSIPVTPFKFDEESVNKPTRFEFRFVAENGLKYIYGYSADKKKIHEEYLYCYKSSKPSLIFERSGEGYKFSRSEKNLLEPLVRMNTENKLFLATATAWNVESTMIPYKWLAEGIDTYTNDDNIQNIALDMYRTNEEENVAFTRKILKQADINICDIHVKSKKIKNPQTKPILSGIMIGKQLIQPQEHYEIEIIAGHTVKKKGKEEKKYTLGLNEESLGTQALFFLAPLLRQTFDEGKVLVIDEIDNSLHPFIIKFLINLFRNKDINKKGAQLVFTTHETTLLSLDTFRRDEVYFTEKDAETGVTDLYSLDEFAVRKDENIEKGYLLGRYGAIPYLHTEELV